MQKAFIFLTFLVIAGTGCKKSENTYTGPYTPPYRIDGLKELNFKKRSDNKATSTQLDLVVNYLNSQQEAIKLSVESLPEGMYSKFLDEPMGFPTFSTRLKITDSTAKPGVYTLKLLATGSTTGVQRYSLNVNVRDRDTCNVEVAANNYRCGTSCTYGSFTQDIKLVPGTTDRVLFTNFDGTGAQIEGIVSCDEGFINIIDTMVNGISYQGVSGDYGTDFNSGRPVVEIVFNRKVPNGNNDVCHLYMEL